MCGFHSSVAVPKLAAQAEDSFVEGINVQIIVYYDWISVPINVTFFFLHCLIKWDTQKIVFLSYLKVYLFIFILFPVN